MSASNDYLVLGLKPGADPEAIRSAYRALARQFHPDLFEGRPQSEKDQAQERFIEICAAYERLSSSPVTSLEPEKPNLNGIDLKARAASLADIVNRNAAEAKAAAVAASNLRELWERQDHWYTSQDTAASNPKPRTTEPVLPSVLSNLVQVLPNKELIKEVSSLVLETLSPEQLAAKYAKRLLSKKDGAAAAVDLMTKTLLQADSIESILRAGTFCRYVLEILRPSLSWGAKEYCTAFGPLYTVFLHQGGQYDDQKQLFDWIRFLKDRSEQRFYTKTEARATAALLQAFLERGIDASTAETFCRTTFKPKYRPLDKQKKIITKLSPALDLIAGIDLPAALPNHFMALDELAEKVEKKLPFVTPRPKNKQDYVRAISEIITHIESDQYVHFYMGSIDNYLAFWTGLAQAIIPPQTEKAVDFADLVRAASRYYEPVPHQYGRHEDWLAVYQEVFPTFIAHEGLFTKGLMAWRELKINNQEEVEWWPGVLHPTVTATSYATQKLVEFAAIQSDPSQVMDGFFELLHNYRKAGNLRHKSVLFPPLFELTPLQEQVYGLINQIKRKNPGGPSRRILRSQAETIVQNFIDSYNN